MKRVPIRSTLVAVVMLSMLVVSVTVSAQAQPASQEAGSVRWLTYVDPRFDFSIRYPSDWVVIPRNDAYGVGATVSFHSKSGTSITDESIVDLHDASAKVEIGMYMVPWSQREILTDKSLRGWVNQYNQLSQVPGVGSKPEESRYIRVGGQRGLRETGQGFSKYRYVSIPRGDVVWFIWSNANSKDDRLRFDRMVSTFKFGESTPATLQDVFGDDFRPSQLIGQQDSSGLDVVSNESGNLSILPLVDSAWKSPLRGSNLAATCNASTHSPDYGGTGQGKSKYAIDVGGTEWVTQVYASRQGTIRFAGWNTNGFGNLVKLERDGLTAFTAHLAGIKEDIYTGKFVNVGTLLGWVGKTGNATGPHLHFEIRNTAPTSVTLVGLSGFTVGVYPYPGSTSPPVGRCGTITY
ncbi:MAG: M23 family metallopeptidase [Anaerolineae bacterium]|uniref:M23 family metallopeptidase n=1 Tax=Promineifilum sp. TaxID=2664178 RepID=UPI0024120EC6|nr:M23 family metallopeptidase [Promineifilum sp.]MCO5180675.1 M23 family metallopeptidase [Promineifilum sp.]MCW5847872.1 M23 family metallopeptidase [Anaerolineae bacterium]